jgi:predicted transcriptional regulator
MKNFSYNEIVEQYISGRTLSEIAKEKGCCITTISNILKKLEIPTRRHKIPPEKEEEIIKFRQEGLTVREIAKRLGCSHGVIYRVCKQNNLRKRYVRFMTSHDIKKAIELYESGKGAREIGEMLGYSDNAIINHLRRNGIKIRDKVESQVLWRKAKNPNYQPGRLKTKEGYIEVKQPDHPRANKKGYVREHVLVWEAAYGKLQDGYVIHHLNGMKDDNRLENLIALPIKSHSQEMRVKDLFLKALRGRIKDLEMQLRQLRLGGA